MFLIIRQVKFINKYKFAKAELNKNVKGIAAHISSLIRKMIIYLAKNA